MSQDRITATQIVDMIQQLRCGTTSKLQQILWLAWVIAEHKGFHDGRPADRDNTLVRLCLLHSEVSEAVQVVKRHGLENRAELLRELADVFVRLGDLLGTLGADRDFCRHLFDVFKANMQRPQKYGTPDATPTPPCSPA